MADAITLVVLAAVGVAMFVSLRAFTRWLDAQRVERRRILCPRRERAVVVDFLVDADGPDVYRDVLACSLLGPGLPVDCGKECRSLSVAPFRVATVAPDRAGG